MPLHVFQNYWDNNGKVFEFTALPKEIQDTIVATCMFQKPTYYAPQVSKSVKEKYFWEIYVALGDCKSLCRTSISIRSTIVKILFAKQEFRYSTTKELSAALTRLNKFKQVVHPTALPQSMSRIARKVRYSRIRKAALERPDNDRHDRAVGRKPESQRAPTLPIESRRPSQGFTWKI